MTVFLEKHLVVIFETSFKGSRQKHYDDLPLYIFNLFTFSALWCYLTDIENFWNFVPEKCFSKFIVAITLKFPDDQLDQFEMTIREME
ncbi:CLUMA_CG021158, isoform A [Clunio marinus]|uniref:CLUMA_CG021158, isoform A n=1 Tax=Clunio marinus TaxID=568069 RepID=A0A1J1J6V6_9DIPT|nr:CLUMA_CG021158, isoform A [Clunio marinus]